MKRPTAENEWFRRTFANGKDNIDLKRVYVVTTGEEGLTFSWTCAQLLETAKAFLDYDNAVSDELAESETGWERGRAILHLGRTPGLGKKATPARR